MRPIVEELNGVSGLDADPCQHYPCQIGQERAHEEGPKRCARRAGVDRKGSAKVRNIHYCFPLRRCGELMSHKRKAGTANSMNSMIASCVFKSASKQSPYHWMCEPRPSKGFNYLKSHRFYVRSEASWYCHFKKLSTVA